MYEAKVLASYEAYRLQFLVLQQQPEVLAAVSTSNVALLKGICESCSRQLRLPTIPSVVDAENVLQELYGPAPSLCNPRLHLDASHEHVLEAVAPFIDRLAARVPTASPASIQHLLALANTSDDRLRDIGRLIMSGGVPESQVLQTLLVLGNEGSLQTQRSTLRCIFHTLSLPQRALEMLELELKENSPLLFAAYELYSEQLYSRSAYIELIDTIVRLVRRRCPEAGKVLSLIDESCLAAVRRTIEGVGGMSMADVACLRSEFASGNAALHAAFSLFCEDGDIDELTDTLKRFSRTWRMRADECLSLQMATDQGLRGADAELLDLSVMNGWIEPSDIIEAAETPAGIQHIVSASYSTLVKHQVPKLHNLVVSLQRSLELSRPDAAFLLQMIDDGQQSEVAHAAFHLYEQDGNRRELIDTLSRLARKWRWDTTLAPFARIIGELRSCGLINKNQVETLELDLVEGDFNVAEVLLNDPFMIPDMLQAAFEHDLFRWKMFLNELLACETAPVHFGVAGLHFLQHLVDGFDVSVMAAISLFEESRDPDELIETLWHVSRRWRAPSTTKGATLSLLESLSLPVEGAMETLELAVYNEDAVVMAAVALCQEGGSRAELVDTLGHVLRRDIGDDSLTEMALARGTIDALGATSCITLVGHRYLHSLLRSSPISGRRHLVQKDEHARVVLQAALNLYNESGSAEEFLDSLKRVASLASKSQPPRANSRWKGDRLDVADMIAFETGSLREDISAVDVDEEIERRRLTRVKGIAYRARLLQRAGLLQDADYNALLRLVDTASVKRAWDRFKHFKVDPTAAFVSAASKWRKRPGLERLLATLEHLQASGLVYSSDVRVVEELLERGEGTELCSLLERKEALLAAMQDLVAREQHRNMERLVLLMQEALTVVLQEETLSGPAEAYLVELVQQQNPVFMAAAVEFEETASAEELCDTLLRLSQSWKRHPNAATLLEICNQLVDRHLLPQHLLPSLEMMVYHRNERCWEALSKFSLQQNNLHMSDLVSVFFSLAREATDRPQLLKQVDDFVALYGVPGAGEQRLHRLLAGDDDTVLHALQRNDAAMMLQLSCPDWPAGSVWAEVNSAIQKLAADNGGPLSELEQNALLQLTADADEVVLAAFVTHSTMLEEGSEFLAVVELVDSLKRIARRRVLGNDQRMTEFDSLELPQLQGLSLNNIDHIVVDAAWYELMETGDYEEFYDTVSRAETRCSPDQHYQKEDGPGQDAPFFSKSALEDYDDIVKTDEIIT